MNNQKGFAHWVIVILISIMAIGLVGAAWYYEGSGATAIPASGGSVERKAYTDSTNTEMASGGSDELEGNSWDSDDNTNDFWLEIKIKGQLLTAKDVTSVNYRWRSVENMCFILGKAVAPGERDRVLALVKDVKGVKSIRDYITGN